MRERFLCPLSRAGACMQQSLSGSSGQEPPLSCWITSRLAGIRGGPQGAVSDVGDPTERLTLLPALRLANRRRCTAPGQSWTAQGVSPDAFDSISPASSPPTNCFRTAGRIAANRFGPRPRLPRISARFAVQTSRSRARSAPGSWAAACCRLVRVVVKLISCSS